jgi:hypothetical protein
MNAVSQVLRRYESWFVRTISIVGLMAALVKLVQEFIH